MKILAIYNNFHTDILKIQKYIGYIFFKNYNETSILIENGQIGEHMFH